MKCDTCAKNLTEDDTYESILCKSCTDTRDKQRCVRCHSILKAGKMFVRAKEIYRNQRKIFLVLGLIMFLIACVIPFSKKVALKLVLGLIGIPTCFILIVVAGFLLFPMTYRLGKWFSDKIEIDLPHDEVGRAIVGWLLGLFVYSFPFIFYGVGALIYRCIIG
jgi:hypothetical protein